MSEQSQREREAARITAWENGLINAIGADLQRVVGYCHDGRDGLDTLVSLCRRWRVPIEIQQGIVLYYQRLSAAAEDDAVSAAAHNEEEKE